MSLNIEVRGSRYKLFTPGERDNLVTRLGESSTLQAEWFEGDLVTQLTSSLNVGGIPSEYQEGSYLSENQFLELSNFLEYTRPSSNYGEDYYSGLVDWGDYEDPTLPDGYTDPDKEYYEDDPISWGSYEVPQLEELGMSSTKKFALGLGVGAVGLLGAVYLSKRNK